MNNTFDSAFTVFAAKDLMVIGDPNPLGVAWDSKAQAKPLQTVAYVTGKGCFDVHSAASAVGQYFQNILDIKIFPIWEEGGYHGYIVPLIPTCEKGNPPQMGRTLMNGAPQLSGDIHEILFRRMFLKGGILMFEVRVITDHTKEEIISFLRDNLQMEETNLSLS